MPAPETRSVATLRDYMQEIEELMSAEVPLWYRGCGRSSYRLVPSLYRHPTISDVQRLIKLETEIMQRFRERSAPYGSDPPIGSTDWELLFVMQHFGVPTRLLDWTENPYMGLFFALTASSYDYDTQSADEDAAVWVLRPGEWNSNALSDISHPAQILSLANDTLQSYEPSADSQYMRVVPVAMFGIYNNPRIVAQRGVFTIFGKDSAPLEEVYARSDYSETTIVKLELPAAAIGQLRKSLFSIGITDSVVYPDMAGLAVELKRFFGFHV
jgi:hypothetical protein